MAQYQDDILPGPEDTSLLYLQSQHISEHVWNNNVSILYQINKIHYS